MKNEPITWTLLGCGASSGVPVPACLCEVCKSSDSKNHRLRTAAWVKTPKLSLLIDTGPDLRQQALKANIQRIDAVFYTHTHADHLNGIDDLRAFCVAQKKPIPVYASADTLGAIEKRFHYAWSTQEGYWDKLALQGHCVKPLCPIELEKLLITPLLLEHGTQSSFGWRMGNAAWLTDLSKIPKATIALLKNLDLLFLDCLRYHPYPAHLNVEKAIQYAQKIEAKKTVLIHMSHDIDYQRLTNECPSKVIVGYDGMVLTSS